MPLDALATLGAPDDASGAGDGGADGGGGGEVARTPKRRMAARSVVALTLPDDATTGGDGAGEPEPPTITAAPATKARRRPRREDERASFGNAGATIAGLQGKRLDARSAAFRSSRVCFAILVTHAPTAPATREVRRARFASGHLAGRRENGLAASCSPRGDTIRSSSRGTRAATELGAGRSPASVAAIASWSFVEEAFECQRFPTPRSPRVDVGGLRDLPRPSTARAPCRRILPFT
jgi:hypothetical protein